MLFKDLHIRNFRGFKEIDVDDLSNINLFLGHNNSGKTSILESIFLLIGMSNPELNIKINNFRDFVHNETEDFNLIFHNFDIEKDIDISSNLFDNSKRGLTISPLFKKSNGSNGLRTIEIDSESSSSSLSNSHQSIKGLRLNFFSKKFHKPKTASKSEISIEDGRIKAEIAKDYKEEYFGAFINSKSSFTDVPSRVEKIIKNKKEKEFVEILKKIDSKIENISLGANGTIYIDIGIDRLVPINFLGDGIRKTLTILSSLYDSKGGVLIIDEFDNGLHYTSIKILWDAIVEYSARYNVQVFVTSHNYDTLKQLEKVLVEQPDKKEDVRSYTINLLKDGIGKAYKYDYDKLSHALTQGVEVRGQLK